MLEGFDELRCALVPRWAQLVLVWIGLGIRVRRSQGGCARRRDRKCGCSNDKESRALEENDLGRVTHLGEHGEVPREDGGVGDDGVHNAGPGLSGDHAVRRESRGGAGGRTL